MMTDRSQGRYFSMGSGKLAELAAAMKTSVDDAADIAINYDWANADEHQSWLDTASVEEIADWAATVKNGSGDIATIVLPTYRCERCGHTWVPRIAGKPKRCPQCKSPYWQKPKGSGRASVDITE